MLVLQDIKIGYDSQTLAKCVGHIAFAKAKFITIIGANGTGKSTLLRCMANGSHLLDGNVSLNGASITEINLEELSQQISILTTDRSMSTSITVRQLLEISRAPYTNFLGKLTPADQSVIDQILTDFELTELKERQLSTLSDGQLQRALIARALVQETEYILMDEPSSHLDIHHKAELLILLKKHCRNHNRTIIFSSHEIAMATVLADQVVYFHEGYIRFKSIREFKEKNILEQMFPSPFLKWENGSYSISESTGEM
ncbi:iron complex transport system ATP-binding protein [Nonlabens sp. Hel1_33_55]|uniref:ABC transporter ATP-binding protein n=1 Tax=Nonlabens sp. Hel1_33_55 TaxID=1336802 RepID=UPI000875D572|nr:ABC transporter ATP-binding protein [Nonlabens sp. Hel1_33_55]SCY12056.1 iron complex transport system ATP-binding protein [Nonlabens sp. Hel1_33_55]